MSQFTYSSKQNPCPICGRVKDGDCRWNKEVFLCHTYIDQDAEVSGYVYRGATDDDMWGQYFLEAERYVSPKFIYSKPIRPKRKQEFVYRDAEGQPLIKVFRQDYGNGQKKFSQSHWNGETWVSGLTDEIKSKLHLYRIFEPINQNAIAQDDPIFLVEGEGKVDRLITLGIAATCSIGGSIAWKRYGYPNYLQDLKEAKLVICPDQDEAGMKHAEAVAQDFPNARWLYAFPESSEWDNLPKKNGLDIADWIEKGATKEQILMAAGDKRDVKIQVDDSKTEETETKPKQKTLADLAIEIASEATYFHTEDGNAYAEIAVDRHREIHPINSKGFKQWLGYQLYTQYAKTLSNQTLNTVLSFLEGKALYEGDLHSVELRVAEVQGKIYIDLGTADWKAVEVDDQGWRIVSKYPVKFRRSPYQLPLPIPASGGKVQELQQILNFDESDWVLVFCWLTFCLLPKHPHPILILHGEQGSGKSFSSRTLKRLIDPAKSPLQPEPKDLRDLAITANNRWLMAFDNLSGISNSQSDALCRIATGGGFTTRTLYENDGETVFEFIRPILINGIDSVATRSDLLERSLLVTLPTISEDRRLTEEELKIRQERVLPRVFGALLTAVSQGLQKLPTVKPETLPRMADFAKWAMAVEAALGFEAGDFLTAYQNNRYTAHETALEASPVAIAIQRLMGYLASWNGTATELLTELDKLVDDKTRKSKYWAGTPRALGKALSRIAPDLRGAGILCDRDKTTGGKRIITLEKVTTETPQTPQSPKASPSQNVSSGMTATTQRSNHQLETPPVRQEAFGKSQDNGKRHAESSKNAIPEKQTELEFQATRNGSGVSGDDNTSLSNSLLSHSADDKAHEPKKLTFQKGDRVKVTVGAKYKYDGEVGVINGYHAAEETYQVVLFKDKYTGFWKSEYLEKVS